MALILYAPAPNFQAATVLPNPKLGDTENPDHEVKIKRAMDGTKYSYVRSSDYYFLIYSFTLTRNKSWELEAFINSYHSALIQIQNWKGEIWEGKLENNPFEFTASRRGTGQTDCTEVVEITLEFKAKKL